ncbi:flagellar biosynthesis protein FlhF [Massilia sp. Dwa41.01b]|uniref:flagellar biosynthesis protein FlhF n=1 Tax=unclassified Massilia TaxID=2609279 RepID=UPI001600E937|nr:MULTISPECIES: flagellar biosynthesis protein FlhF [unclassified Massilia]QNA90106.1 flagellar biosynthesis protein FlhF [Massilia sp. Dwa41.01b]QNB00995.1 flagellar biosynthesis protein FlhF [Massilia sp. Se16.2.3]
MNVKKFTAATSREALRKVRDALGPDAVILSNRPVDGVVEILALDNDDVASLAAPAAGSPMAQPAPRLDHLNPFDDAEPAFVNRRSAAPAAPAPEHVYATRRAPAMEPEFEAAFAAPRRAAAPAPAPAAAPAFDMSAMTQMMQAAIAQAQESAAQEMSGMMSELRAMRGMMETQLAELSWGGTQQREPHKAAVLREMLGAGFSASLSRYLIDKMPANKDAAEAMRWIKTVLARNLTTMADEDSLLEKGGVFALVGPTGVGKTTTTAKLAARCVMRHGAEKLALITTDAYRIGGHEQLRIYGKILGVMVHSVKDEADLRIALKELKNKHTVLIDTIGMSQRDQMVTEQVAMLNGAGADVKRLLCLNATATNETLAEVVRAYQGSGLHGCIMTKLDEAASIGNVLDVMIRQKLNLHYISNGQRVPEDLHLADRAMLVDRAFRGRRDAASQFEDADLPLMMARAGKADDSLREVRFV